MSDKEINFDEIDEDELTDEDDLPEDDDDDSGASDEAKTAPIKEEDIPKVAAVDDEKEKLRTEAANLRAEIAAEKAARQAAIEEANAAKRTSLQANIDHAQKIAQGKREELLELQTQLELARSAGDGERSADLVRKMAKINQDYIALDNEARNWGQSLNNLQAAPKQEAKVEKTAEKPKVDDTVPAEVRKKGGEWAQRNAWYNDPTFSAKREKAQGLYNELVTKNYNPATDQFWKYMDTKLAEFDKEPQTRRSAPPVRPIGATNTGVSKMTQQKKIDQEALRKTKEFFELSGKNELNTNPEKLKKMRQNVYNSTLRQLKAQKNATA